MVKNKYNRTIQSILEDAAKRKQGLLEKERQVDALLLQQTRPFSGVYIRGLRDTSKKPTFVTLGYFGDFYK